MAEFTYDPTTGRYRDTQGHLVPEATVRTGLAQLVSAAEAHVAVLSQRLAEGTLSPPDYRAQMRTELKHLHTTSALLAHGGKAQMDAATRRFVTRRLTREYVHLDVLTLDFATQRISAAILGARADMYPNAAVGTYEGIRATDAPSWGMRRVRNHVSSREPCTGCSAATALGWVPLGLLTLPGTRDCKSRCRCHLEYDDSPLLAVV